MASRGFNVEQNFAPINEEEELSNEDLKFQSFPKINPADGNMENDNDNNDNQDLLSNEKKPPSFWTFEYYQQFFDVESTQVMSRLVGSMLPNFRKNYLQNFIRPNPDLYGPFWVCTTLVFTTAIAGNMANYFQNVGDYKWNYDFHKVTFAAAAIYSYWWLIPCIIYGILWWRGSRANFTFLEIICIYGYSLFIYIPISIFWLIQIPILQWILAFIGATLSGSVLLLTFYPAVKHENKRILTLILMLIMFFHVALAIGFVFYFFRVPQTSITSPTTDITTTTTTTTKINLSVSQLYTTTTNNTH